MQAVYGDTILGGRRYMFLCLQNAIWGTKNCLVNAAKELRVSIKAL